MTDEEIQLTVFVACYNEEASIHETLETVVAACGEAGISFEIVVVDDAAKGRYVEIMQAFQESHAEVRLILRVNLTNEGLGNNYAEAAFIGHGTWYRLVCGDNVEPRETLVKVFSQTGKAELIIPYRPDESSRSGFRQLVSKIFTWLVNFTSGHHIRYYNVLPLTRRYYVMRS